MTSGENFPTIESSLCVGLSRLQHPIANPQLDLAAGGEDDPAPRSGESADEAHQRYLRSREIARGGMGAVYEVVDNDLRRTLAMKVLLASDRGNQKVDPLALARFLEEAQITGQLDHPGIVPLHEVGMDAEGRVYFTMRLVRGRHLGEVFACVRKGEFGWTTARAVEALIKVGEAMAYAHAKGVVHRDLKPQNIMCGRFGEVYVMDWGLAKVTGRPHRAGSTLAGDGLSVVATERESGSGLVSIAGTVFGTPAYMAPEQARGDLNAIDARSDVYSFGSILYHLLTGHAPYVPQGAQLSAATVLQCVLEGPPTPIRKANPTVPVELAAIAAKAMARESAQRYQHMLEIVDDLRAWLAGNPVSAYHRSPLSRAVRWCRRYPVVAASLVAITFGGAYGVSRLNSLAKELTVAAVRDAAEQEAKVLEKVNSLYAANVAGRVDRDHVMVTHDYREHAGAIPIPATFLTELTADLSTNASGVAVKHYSDYPFRFRGEPKLDAFGRRALEELRKAPGVPVEEIDDVGGRPVLRYAVARQMGESCVACHNSHPDSTKTDWKVGDVRGVLEIQRPLDENETRSRDGLTHTLLVMSAVIIVLVGIAAVALLRTARVK